MNGCIGKQKNKMSYSKKTQLTNNQTKVKRSQFNILLKNGYIFKRYIFNYQSITP